MSDLAGELQMQLLKIHFPLQGSTTQMKPLLWQQSLTLYDVKYMKEDASPCTDCNPIMYKDTLQ